MNTEKLKPRTLRALTAFVLASMQLVSMESVADGNSSTHLLENPAESQLQRNSSSHIHSEPGVELPHVTNSEGCCTDYSMDTRFRAFWNIETIDPEIDGSLTLGLREHGIDVTDTNIKPISDILNAAGGHAKDLAARWNDSHPLSFYGALAGSTVAAAAYSYLKGSGELESIGMYPEFRKDLFDSRLIIMARASWEPKFASVSADGAIGTRWNLSTAASLQGYVFFNQQGAQGISASYQMGNPADQLLFKAGGRYNFQTGQAHATLSLQYQPSNNMDFVLFGGIDSVGESMLGVGLTWRQ